MTLTLAISGWVGRSLRRNTRGAAGAHRVLSVACIATVQLLVLPSLAFGDIPYSLPLVVSMHPAALVVTALVAGCSAALGLRGLKRMARVSRQMEEIPGPDSPGEETT